MDYDCIEIILVLDRCHVVGGWGIVGFFQEREKEVGNGNGGQG